MSTGKPTLLQVRNAIQVLERAGLLESFDPWGGAQIAKAVNKGMAMGVGKSGRKPPTKRRKKKKWTHVSEEDVRQFNRLVRSGATKVAAAKIVGHHASTMAKHVSKLKETK